MDETDRKLLELLALNARAPTAEIARRLGLSRTTVQSRIERLERTGAIAGYTVKISKDANDAVEAYVMITLAHAKGAAAVSAIGRIAEVRSLRSVSGPFDLMATLRAANVSEMDVAIDRIGTAPGVERTTSAIVLSSKIDR